MYSPWAGRYSLRGFSHSEISGSEPASGFPELIAAVHVLHRLSSPRHPPCALRSLTVPLRHASSSRPESERRCRLSPFATLTEDVRIGSERSRMLRAPSFALRKANLVL